MQDLTDDFNWNWELLLFQFSLEATVIPCGLEKLDMVVLAVEYTFMCNVVRWTNGAPSVTAFETASMVCISVHRNL